MHYKHTLVAVVSVTVLASGCATKKYVQQEVAALQAAQTQTNTRVDGVEGQVEANQTKLREHDEQFAKLSVTAQEAVTRAEEAGKIAAGKLVYETVLSDENTAFALSKSEISAEAKTALDELAAELIDANEGIYLEIQGHTDATGSEQYNYELGLERAEAARRYLAMSHKIPLHKMSVISYGESAPIADNATREGRSKNRRVVVVVLK
jgi:outer membrane protein OmpA-like peptidoglycan-associated protein